MTRAVLVKLPTKTSNPLNGSMGTTVGGRRARAKARRVERDQARAFVLAATGRRPLEGPFEVVLTRRSAGVLDDDGLRGALKSIRDGVSDALAVDDGDLDQVVFIYRQATAKRGEYGVEVLVCEVLP